MAKHTKVLVVSLTLFLAVIALLTWVFYEYAVKPHIGCTELNTWGKILVINSSLNIVMLGLSFGVNLLAKMYIQHNDD